MKTLDEQPGDPSGSQGPELDKGLQEKIRQGVEAGLSVADLIRLIRSSTGQDKPGEGRMAVGFYLTRTLDLSLRDVIEILGWVGFEDGGASTDDEVEASLGKHLPRPRDPQGERSA